METEQSNEELILGFLAEGGDDFISGATLSDKLGLSRAAVWKHVEKLRDLGYRIDAQPARGYRLMEVPDRLTELELQPLLTTRDLGRTLHCFETVESTNATAFALGLDGAFHGEVVVAEAQTKGRGRRGRGWVSPPGTNLYLSAVLRPEVAPSRAPELTLVTAVALTQTLQEAGVRAVIKWPNDIQVGGKKVAGILTELSADEERVRFVIVGVGVNLNMSLDELPEDVAAIATSVSAERGEAVPRALFTAAFLANFERWLDRWHDQGFETVREAWREATSTLGHEVLVVQEGDEWVGVAEDIDESGALMVRVGGSLRRVLAGDVQHLKVKKNG